MVKDFRDVIYGWSPTSRIRTFNGYPQPPSNYGYGFPQAYVPQQPQPMVPMVPQYPQQQQPSYGYQQQPMMPPQQQQQFGFLGGGGFAGQQQQQQQQEQEEAEVTEAAEVPPASEQPPMTTSRARTRRPVASIHGVQGRHLAVACSLVACMPFLIFIISSLNNDCFLAH